VISFSVGRGGSREGAGRRLQHSRVERTFSIDVRDLKRRGLDKVTDDEWFGFAGLAMRRNGSWLDVQCLSERASLSVQIALVRTPCPLGGSRPWFACPICERRCLVIFVIDGQRLTCRTCGSLRYESQREDQCMRGWRKQRSVEKVIGAKHERPRGMHAKTYKKLLAQIQRAGVMRDQWLLRAAAPMMRSLDIARLSLERLKRLHATPTPRA
jgi:hypothetical protein